VWVDAVRSCLCGEVKYKAHIQIESNEVEFICDHKNTDNNTKEVKQENDENMKTMRQHDTKLLSDFVQR